MSRRRRLEVAALLALSTSGAAFRVPGVNYPAQVREDVSILPGGRALRPFGRQVLTGTAPFAIAVSPSGKTIVTANIGPSRSIGLDRPSITVIIPGKHDSAWTLSDFNAEPRRADSKAWQGVTTGIVAISDGSAWLSEGDTGRVVELSLSSGGRKASVNLNVAPYADSFTDGLAYDAARNLLFALDVANYRVAVIDPKRVAVVSSVKTGAMPSAMALSADGNTLYVAATVPPSLDILDVSDPAAPKSVAEIPLDGEAPSGVAVHSGEVWVSLAHDDRIAVLNASTRKLEAEIPLRIPGLEAYRGVTPLGLAFDAKAGVLLVAEAGINAVGIIDPKSRKLTGHIPVGWFPAALAVHDGQVYVAGSRGIGTGPSSQPQRVRMGGGGGGGRQSGFTFQLEPEALRRGSVSAFTVPAGADLAAQTGLVMEANGFKPSPSPAAKGLPPIHNIVLIVKGDRTFDEIFGDITEAGGKSVLAAPYFARFGNDGYVSGGKRQFSLHVPVTPNHHEIAARWSFGDNFYVDGENSEAGDRWLAGECPGWWSETGLLYHEAGNREPIPSSSAPGRKLFALLPPQGLSTHLERAQISFRDFHDSRDLGSDYHDAKAQNRISDQVRVNRFVAALQHDYLEPGKPLPQLMLLRLPNDTGGPPNADEGFPYSTSWIADNDYALGRVIEFLSTSPWWKQMAVFVTESGSEGGADHVDSHRVPMLAAGPWLRTNYVSHTNASVPALYSTIFKLLGVSPLNLYDAAAGDLLDMFASAPDNKSYQVVPEDPRLFDPEKVKLP